VCYFLRLASPLTLSEVRSMLPPGLAADPLPPKVAQAYGAVTGAPIATVALLLSGACSCDLVLPRDSEAREDERHLRQRYRELGLSRNAIIEALERHRRGGHPPSITPADRASALAAFVAEHARNAGPSVYDLQFGLEPSYAPPSAVTRMPAAVVRAAREPWLVEGRAVLVTR
jgi:hypothetical protein